MPLHRRAPIFPASLSHPRRGCARDTLSRSLGQHIVFEAGPPGTSDELGRRQKRRPAHAKPVRRSRLYGKIPDGSRQIANPASPAEEITGSPVRLRVNISGAEHATCRTPAPPRPRGVPARGVRYFLTGRSPRARDFELASGARRDGRASGTRIAAPSSSERGRPAGERRINSRSEEIYPL